MAKDLLISILVFVVLWMGYTINESRYQQGIKNGVKAGAEAGYDKGAREGYEFGIKQCIDGRPA